MISRKNEFVDEFELILNIWETPQIIYTRCIYIIFAIGLKQIKVSFSRQLCREGASDDWYSEHSRDIR